MVWSKQDMVWIWWTYNRFYKISKIHKWILPWVWELGQIRDVKWGSLCRCAFWDIRSNMATDEVRKRVEWIRFIEFRWIFWRWGTWIWQGTCSLFIWTDTQDEINQPGAVVPWDSVIVSPASTVSLSAVSWSFGAAAAMVRTFAHSLALSLAFPVWWPAVLYVSPLLAAVSFFGILLQKRPSKIATEFQNNHP